MGAPAHNNLTRPLFTTCLCPVAQRTAPSPGPSKLDVHNTAPGSAAHLPGACVPEATALQSSAWSAGARPVSVSTAAADPARGEMKRFPAKRICKTHSTCTKYMQLLDLAFFPSTHPFL